MAKYIANLITGECNYILVIVILVDNVTLRYVRQCAIRCAMHLICHKHAIGDTDSYQYE